MRYYVTGFQPKRRWQARINLAGPLATREEAVDIAMAWFADGARDVRVEAAEPDPDWEM